MTSKLYVVCVMTLFLIGCSSATYNLDVAATGTEYTEKFPLPLNELLTLAHGSPVTTLEGNNQQAVMKGPGFRIGIVEELYDFIVTRISYYRTSFEELTYKFNVQGLGDYTQKTKTTVSGADISIGINLWILRPSYVIKTANYKSESMISGAISESMTTDDKADYRGLGIALEIETGPYTQFYVEYQALEEYGDYAADTSLRTVMLGIRLGPSGYSGKGKKSEKQIY